MTLLKKKKYTVSKWIITGNIGNSVLGKECDLYKNLDEENELITHENIIAKPISKRSKVRSLNENNDAEKKEAGLGENNEVNKELVEILINADNILSLTINGICFI